MILEQPLVSRSGRVMLVQSSEADDEAVLQLRLDPSIQRFFRFHPTTLTVEQVRESRLASLQDPSHIMLSVYLVDREGPERSPSPSIFAGEMNVRHIETYRGRSCEIGLALLPQFLRRDTGTDAVWTLFEYVFGTLRMHRVAMSTLPENTLIRVWAEKGGFMFEGVQRESWADGRGGYEDTCLYSLSAQTWREKTLPFAEANLKSRGSRSRSRLPSSRL